MWRLLIFDTKLHYSHWVKANLSAQQLRNVPISEWQASRIYRRISTVCSLYTADWITAAAPAAQRTS